MSRFQAQTNAVLDHELEELRQRFGLAPSQKADLLREVAAIAAWVIRQAEAGRSVEARRGTEVEPLKHPVIERLRTRHETAVPHITLTDAEVERLARILDRGFEPTPALRAALQNLASPKRRPPKLRWKKLKA
jgi:hypothetical protein